MIVQGCVTVNLESTISSQISSRTFVTSPVDATTGAISKIEPPEQ